MPIVNAPTRMMPGTLEKHEYYGHNFSIWRSSDGLMWCATVDRGNGFFDHGLADSRRNIIAMAREAIEEMDDEE